MPHVPVEVVEHRDADGNLIAVEELEPPPSRAEFEAELARLKASRNLLAVNDPDGTTRHYRLQADGRFQRIPPPSVSLDAVLLTQLSVASHRSRGRSEHRPGQRRTSRTVGSRGDPSKPDDEPPDEPPELDRLQAAVRLIGDLFRVVDGELTEEEFGLWLYILGMRHRRALARLRGELP